MQVAWGGLGSVGRGEREGRHAGKVDQEGVGGGVGGHERRGGARRIQDSPKRRAWGTRAQICPNMQHREPCILLCMGAAGRRIRRQDSGGRGEGVHGMVRTGEEVVTMVMPCGQRRILSQRSLHNSCKCSTAVEMLSCMDQHGSMVRG